MKKIRVFSLFLFFGSIIFFITDATLAKYTTTVHSSDSVKIALFANDLVATVPSTQNIYPGSDPILIPIEVTNKKDGKICDVTENYKIEIKNNDHPNIPLNYQFCKDEHCNTLVSQSNGIYEDDSFKFQAGVEEKNTLYLKVSWPEEYNDSSYAFEIDYIQLKFILTQED